jgi:hypothetical protein
LLVLGSDASSDMGASVLMAIYTARRHDAFDHVNAIVRAAHQTAIRAATAY